ncbi:MAG: gfo/Idh/MocA family oxidoreductase, partial [Candidatus Marinimicrobia bacterium]|nr:gfo/Idh/MocA family oxidoreductase [Candidatus Neomarinimicrobiota bacterium]
MDRRNFLRSAFSIGFGGLSLLAAGKPLRSQSTRVAASDRITMGFIGLGGNGTWNLRDFVTRDAVRVVALCDVDRNHLNRAGDIVADAYGSRDYTFYSDYRALLSRQDIDAVFISTPDHWHALNAIHAAKAGKDVFCQKPLGYNISEGKAMVDAVHKAGIVWQTGSQQRSS